MSIENLIGKGIRGALGVVTGGLSESVIGIVEGALGPDADKMPPEARLRLEAELAREITKREMAGHTASLEAERALTQRIGELEGTAKDLKAMPVLGPVMLFLRGCQRPVWGFGTLFMDYMVFSQEWPLPPDSAVESAFFAINILVAGFLFGERAMKNVMPYLTRAMAARSNVG